MPTDHDLQTLVARVRARPREGRLLSGWPGCISGLVDALGIGMGAQLTPEFYAAADRMWGFWDGCEAVQKQAELKAAWRARAQGDLALEAT